MFACLFFVFSYWGKKISQECRVKWRRDVFPVLDSDEKGWWCHAALLSSPLVQLAETGADSQCKGKPCSSLP